MIGTSKHVPASMGCLMLASAHARGCGRLSGAQALTHCQVGSASRQLQPMHSTAPVKPYESRRTQALLCATCLLPALNLQLPPADSSADNTLSRQALKEQQAALERQFAEDAALAARTEAKDAAREQAQRQQQVQGDWELSREAAALTVARPSKQPPRFVPDFAPTYPLMGKGKRKARPTPLERGSLVAPDGQVWAWCLRVCGEAMFMSHERAFSCCAWKAACCCVKLCQAAVASQSTMPLQS